jgi:hypothetical protein
MRKSLTAMQYKRKVAALPSLIRNMKRFEERALKRYESALRKRRRGAEITSIELDLSKPPKSHVSWTATLESVRKDPRTPAGERRAEQTLHE